MGATNGAFWTQQFLKPTGLPYTGVRAFHYVAGNTTTNLDVYQNGDLTAPHNNPVVGDASGRVSFYGSGTYRLLIKSSTADGNLTLYDWDPVELVHHTATVRAEDKGLSLPAATSAARGRLFGVTDGGGDLTALWIQRTAAAWMQLLTLPTLSQMIEFRMGTTIASTTNVTIPGDGNVFNVTGTNPIETFSSFTGAPLIFTRTLSALTFIHSGSLVLQGAQNRTTLANQVTAWLYFGAGVWVELGYTTPLLGDSSFIDGAVLVGNVQGQIVDVPLPTASRVFGHLGVAGQDPSWITGLLYHGPTSTGSGSTAPHEGTVIISSNQALSGIHFYTDFTLNAGITLTLGADTDRLLIYASNSITVNGTINAAGAGSPSGGAGFTQPAGGGGGGTTSAGTAGGSSLLHGVIRGSGGGGGGASTPGGTGGSVSQQSGANCAMANPFAIPGGAGGGSGGSGPGGSGGGGGAGGGSIILVAPVISLGTTCVLNTSGIGGTGGGSNSGGGGGGGAGNVYIVSRLLTDTGATFTMTGGGSGPNGSNGGPGGAGAAGVREILIYG